MTLNRLFIILVVATVILIAALYINLVRLLTVSSVDTSQDEKEWAADMQKDRDRRSIEAGMEAFEKLDKIYGNPPLTD